MQFIQRHAAPRPSRLDEHIGVALAEQAGQTDDAAALADRKENGITQLHKQPHRRLRSP